jgi:two-component system nitrate/nitrite response regulator NarL
MTSPIRICIIEDHAIVRAGLKMLLRSQPGMEVVGEAVGRKGAFEIAARERPNLLVVDVQLGGECALDFLEDLLTQCEAKAILLTGSANEDQIHRAMEAGAMGLVYKEEDPEMLIRAIKGVHAGEAWFSRSLMTSALSRLRTARSAKARPDREAVKIASLTAREREIVALIAGGLNRKKIAEQLFVSDATVRNHLTSIFSKLEVSNQFELVFFAQRHGLDKVSSAEEAPSN